MKHIQKVKLLLAGGLLTLAAHAGAATVNVEWKDPGEFRDIRATDTNQKAFQKRVMEEMEAQFKREAVQLAAGQTLLIQVEDLDLAGEIEYFYRNHPFGLRVIRNVDYPQMQLSYELRDANDTLIKTGSGLVKDMGFRFSNLMPIDRSALKYEKELIHEWYRQEF